MIKNTIENKDASLRFRVIKTDRFKMSRLSFNFVLPADEKGSPVTKLMLAVMMRGCRKYPSVVSINKRLDELYGATVTWRAVSVGDRHVFRISCEMLSNKFRFSGDFESVVDSVCQVIMDILFDPLKDENGLLDEANFESEKKLAIDAVKAKINDQKSYAAERCRDIMFEGHGCGISVDGDEELLEKITLREISENISHFLQNSLLECYYIGSDDISSVVETVTERFSSVDRSGARLHGSETAFVPKSEEIGFFEETMPVSQGRLNIGCTGGVVMSAPEYYAASLFNEIFGGSSVAKLFMNVREKQSLCYYCYSSYGSATGTMMIACGINPENREKAFDEIKYQLSEMQAGNFTAEEIETAKKTIVSGMRQIYDSPSAMEAYEFRRVLAGVDERVEDSINKVLAVTREDIISVAARVKLNTVYFLWGESEEGADDDEEY